MRHRKTKKGTRRQAQALDRALHVLSRMRRTGATLTAASREEHIDPRTVKKYVATDLRRLKKVKQTVATKSDRRRRRMLIPTALGTTAVIVSGSRKASLLGRYMSAVGQYLRTGNTQGLSAFKGKSIGEHDLITDPEVLNVLAEAGSLQLEEIYALPESSS
jgi:hypothetical protein